ncbi:thymidine phosphorylase family protein [Reyranella sp.]|uniref:thymidine phosphorylase family protein n=1 Tax=Reyranella sp. TaxID=1929291 RepID=UPI002731431F|nr:thymidine phosphorylase family protein [Reyranella sp.]MDP2373667.1 thymidine phosphorylase family protein [Reyranella sp.]
MSSLRLKKLGIDTCHETVAFLARRCPLYRAEEFVALARIEITGGGRRIVATLNIVDDESIMEADELGLSLLAHRHLGLPDGTPVQISQATPPPSLDHVRAKIDGAVLSPEAYRAIAQDLVAHRYSKMEIAAFLIASARFTTAPEVLSLTRAMASVGGKLVWDGDVIVDKHCIGGIPGNRTSMIVVPIVAAHGLKIPKTSSRAITSPAGTADTMEVLARVDVGPDEMREIVAAENGCLVWGGHANLSPADDVLISVERPLAIDTPEQMVASILSKKLAAGSTHLVLDLPVGPTAKLRSRESFVRLRKLFEYIADEVGLNAVVIGTDGSQPVGRGIGPWLEVRDVMQVLDRDPAAPRDLEERALLLAGHVLEFDPALRGGRGIVRARELLESGAAARKMRQLMKAQGPPPKTATLGSLRHDVVAPRDGVVEAVDCLRLARIARLAGAPIDKGAGVDFFKKIGDPVEKGEPLYRIHAAFEADFRFASKFASEGDGVTIAGPI